MIQAVAKGGQVVFGPNGELTFLDMRINIDGDAYAWAKEAQERWNMTFLRCHLSSWSLATQPSNQDAEPSSTLGRSEA